jgi:hypothetical protein
MFPPDSVLMGDESDSHSMLNVKPKPKPKTVAKKSIFGAKKILLDAPKSEAKKKKKDEF